MDSHGNLDFSYIEVHANSHTVNNNAGEGKSKASPEAGMTRLVVASPPEGRMREEEGGRRT